MSNAYSPPGSVPKIDYGQILRDAVLASLVAFGLFALLIGVKTDQSLNNQMILVLRPGMLALVCAAVFVGRLAIGVYLARRDALGPARPKKVKGDLALKLEKYGLPVFVGFLFAYPLMVLATAGPSGAIKWIDNFGIQILIYIMLGWGLNIVVGLAGLLDLGYVAFYAVGAYSYALLATSEPVKAFMADLIGPSFWPLWAFWICLPVAGILAAFWGVLLGFPVLRLRGDYLAIVTLSKR